MDNTISGINNNMVNYSVDNAKNQIKTDQFQKTLEKAYGEKDKKQLKKVCRDFEQILLNMMYKQMRATIPKSGLTEGSFARETFEGMLDEKFAEEAAKGQGIGLADMLYKNLIKNMDSVYKPTDKT